MEETTLKFGAPQALWFLLLLLPLLAAFLWCGNGWPRNSSRRACWPS
jgi:hypothetical protein